MKNIVKKIGALVLVWVVCLATLSPAYAAKADLPELPKDQCVVDEPTSSAAALCRPSPT